MNIDVGHHNYSVKIWPAILHELREHMQIGQLHALALCSSTSDSTPLHKSVRQGKEERSMTTHRAPDVDHSRHHELRVLILYAQRFGQS